MAGESYLKTTLTTFAVLFLLAQMTFGALPRYEIIDLGTLGGIHSAGRSINDKGQVVGYAENSLGLERATLFDPTGNGNNIDLGTLDGQYSKAFSINSEGQIVGQASNASGYTHATLFHPTGEGNNIDLGTLGGDRSYASSINDIGQIVGWARIASGERHATLFDTTGAGDNIDLGTLGGDESWASSINNSSQIVGTAYRLFTTTGGRLPPVTSSYLRATLFDATGQGNNIDLGTLLYTYGICCCSGAMSINDSGQIVGAAWNVNPFPVVKTMAVLFDPTGGENNIFLSSPAEHYSFAYSINNRAQIIGWGGLCSNNPCGTGPVLFDPAGQGNNVNLYDLIDPCCGWILKEVWSINDSGWIVGEGINPAGRHHAFLMKPIPPKTIYVDDDASGANDGSSWADAYNYLQDALAAAWSGDEIHVAQGIYKPDQGAGITPGDREATFQLINGVTIEGGYAGTGTLDPNARDIQLYETILNGDLDGNDIIDVNYPWGLWNEPTRAENSYHVVTGTGTDQTPVLDGFTITAGNANATWPDNHGGGMYNFDCSPTLIKCTFNSNSAYMGAAMVNYHSSPTIIDCTFNENESGGGSGMVNKYSSPTVINCTFSGNSGHGTSTSTAGVGGMYNYKSSPTITNCTFSGNFGGEGGMYNDSSNPMITNCTFSGNYSGGMVNSESSPILTNCTFSGNTAIWSGAGIYNYYNSQPTLTNCILWNDSNEIWNGDDSTITITYSDVQGGWPGQGNIDAAPLFVDPGYWEDPCNTPDTPWDDVWIDGDYHLLLGSPCIDAGDPNYVAGPNETDLDGNPRVMGGRVDMGAYEAPIPAEAGILPKTINLASKGNWITALLWLPEQYNVAGIEPNSIFLEDEIKPEQFSVNEQQQFATARFSRQDVQPILEAGDINLKITGRLTDGTVFEGTDTIKVINKTGKN